MTKAESFAMQYGYYDKEKKRACCVGYNAGYKQAEKDLAMTWEDMREIIRIDIEMMDDPEAHPEWMEEQPFYEEVLKRFNNAKNGKD